MHTPPYDHGTGRGGAEGPDGAVLARLDALTSMVARLAPPTVPAVSVADLWELFRSFAETRLRSWRDYRQRWRDHVEPAFGALQAGALAPGEVDAYRARRVVAGAAVATVNREVALLRRLLNFGVRRGKLPKSQLHGPGMTRELIHPEDNVRTTVVEEDAAARVTLDDLLSEATPDLRAFILLVHHSGMRRAEAAVMQWDRIRDGVAWIPSTDTKGKRAGRVVPVSSAAMLALQELPRRADSPWVFASRHHGVKGRAPRHPDHWTKVFGKLVRKLGIDGPDGPPWLHDLRRSFVTLSRRDGESERAIMNITGHRTRAVFDRYDAYDVRDVLLFRERRELARSKRKGPHRAPAKESSVPMSKLVDSAG